MQGRRNCSDGKNSGAVTELDCRGIAHDVDLFGRPRICLKNERQVRRVVLFIPGGREQIVPAAEEEQVKIPADLPLLHETGFPVNGSKRIIDRIDRFGMKIQRHHAVMVFGIVGIASVVAQVVPSVADGSAAP